MMRGFFFVLTFTGALSAQSMVEFGAITAGTAVGGVAGKAVSAEQMEITRLKAELARMRMERDILKKAAAYFAKERP